VPLDSALAISGSGSYTDSARQCEKSFRRRIVGTVVIVGMAIAGNVDVLVPARSVLGERLASRRSGKVPGHANVPQLSPLEGD
jgi:Zn-dependent alcohol dehydrogenase